jgi:carboxylate-amine ligase
MLSPNDLRATFDAAPTLTVGIEEEVFLLDPATLEPAPVARALLDGPLSGDPRFKAELPAAQLELVTPPCAGTGEAIEHLRAARGALLDAVDGRVRPVAVAVPPLGPEAGVLNAGGRYDRIADEYGEVGRRQLVSALQVHVAVGSADGTLAVYNALREYLPEIAALAANGVMYAGRDSGFASVRPLIGENLPRQGMAPPIASWEAFAGELAWGAASGTVPEPAMWWWELRPHVAYGTLEVRVPDAQATIGDAAGVTALVHALVAHLAARPAGDPVPTWRIEENRWAACRHGLDGHLADLRSGERRPARERLRALLAELEDAAGRVGADLDAAHRLLERNGAERQRRAGSPAGAARWAADAYAPGS